MARIQFRRRLWFETILVAAPSRALGRGLGFGAGALDQAEVPILQEKIATGTPAETELSDEDHLLPRPQLGAHISTESAPEQNARRRGQVGRRIPVAVNPGGQLGSIFSAPVRSRQADKPGPGNALRKMLPAGRDSCRGFEIFGGEPGDRRLCV